MNKIKHDHRSGAVSLFVVIFAAILLTGVAVGFTILMLSDQNRSADNDLAQSAKDSAEAGVEDAKRILAKLSSCKSSGAGGDECAKIQSAINLKECNTISKALGDDNSRERKIATTQGESTDDKLSQAYTCVIINQETDSYVGKTNDEGDMKVVPLSATGAYDTVEISWLNRANDNIPADINLDVKVDDKGLVKLPAKKEWGKQGSILRVSAVPLSKDDQQRINVNMMDDNSRTAFLYSSKFSKTHIKLFEHDAHKPIREDSDSGDMPFSINKIAPVKCENNKSSDYLCKTSIQVKEDADDNLLYLTLASMYRSTSFRLTLKNSKEPNSVVKFNGVQPEIDSTGRANDVFRRIVSRVEAIGGDSAPFPRAALGSNGNLCKSYTVTDNEADYKEDGNSDAKKGCYELREGKQIQ